MRDDVQEPDREHRDVVASASDEATLIGLDPREPSLDADASHARSSDTETEDPSAIPRRRRADPAWPRVGRFELRRRLGMGAMGVVFEAHDPMLDRAVAVKVLHAEMPRAAQRRMQHEALSLAKLSHPNVVQVFEVGESEGRTFIAMELVRGQTLDAWARRRPPPSWRECVAVYAQAGAGLVAAHAAGLAHRDLKPSNCILGDDGRVRVLDFGLAKAVLDEPEADDDSATSTLADAPRWEPALTQGIVGTPAYMAPEQLADRRAGPAADQYSLCASLWEALYGQRAFTAETLPELTMRVLDGQITEPASGAPVPRWLRAIVVRGLAVDPARRWPSVQVLLDALARGRARAQRRRGLAVLGTIVMVGAAGAGVRWYDEQQRIAACEADGASITEVWNGDVAATTMAALEGTGLSRAPATVAYVRPWLDAHARAWQEARSEACLDAHVRGRWDGPTLDRAQWCLDERRMELEALVAELGSGRPRSVDMAVTTASRLTRVEPCRDAAELARLPTPPSASREAVRSVKADLEQAWVLERAGSYDEGLALAHAAAERAEAIAWPPVIASAHITEGTLLESKGQFADAERRLEDAFFVAIAAGSLETAELAAGHLATLVGGRLERHAEGLRWSRHQEALVSQLPDPLGLRQVRVLHDAALVLYAEGHYAEAVDRLERAIELEERVLGPDHPDLSASLSTLANAHTALGHSAEAARLHERAVAIAEASLGPTHPDVATFLNNLAFLHASMGEYARAKAIYERALAIREESLGPDHADLAHALNNLGTVCEALGELERAQALYERALAIRERALGPEHTDVASTLSNLAGIHHARGEHEAARALDERALAIGERALGPEHPMVAQYLNNVATDLQDAGELSRAKLLYERALPIVEASMGSENQVVAAILANLALLARHTDGCERALPSFERALAVGERALGPDHADLAATLDNLADCHRELGAVERAQAEHARALAILEAALGPEHPALGVPLFGLAELALEAGRPADAMPLAERAVRLTEAGAAGPLEMATARLVLAHALWQSGGAQARARARSLAEAARDGCRGLGDAGSECSQRAQAWLAEHRR